MQPTKKLRRLQRGAGIHGKENTKQLLAKKKSEERPNKVQFGGGDEKIPRREQLLREKTKKKTNFEKKKDNGPIKFAEEMN